MRRQRFQIGADLIGDIAVGGGAVGADDTQIDHPVLHQMAAGVVGDDGVRHAVLAEFPRGQRRTLVARAGFVDPDMDGMPRIVAI